MIIDSDDIVSGQKRALMGEFQGLYSIHRRKWRSMLQGYNDWHSTAKGLLAWQNISRGTVGNEALRLIISDMKAIVLKSSKSNVLKRQGFVRKQP